MKEEKNRRKQYIINREIQLGVTFRFIFFFILAIFFSTGSIFLPSIVGMMTETRVEKLIVPAQEFLILHKRIWPMVLVFVVGIVIYTVLLTHRIVGPIYRLNRELRNMIEGKYSENILLRKKDFFKETASLVEELGQKLNEQQQRSSPDDKSSFNGGIR